MEAIAKLNNCPTAPRKMRLVVDMIRGLDVEQALNILKYSSKEAAGRVEKLLLSAINNWEQKNDGLSADDNDLYVAEVYVTQGRTLKRFRPAPMGRAHRIRKRSNHVYLKVDSRLPLNVDNTEFSEVEAEETNKEDK